MASLNRVVLVGNLTRDPEMRFTPAGKPVGKFGIAVNRIPYTDDQGNRQEGVDFFNVVVFGRQAETAHQYLKKGSGVAIDGKIQSRSWETDDGQKRSAVEVVAQNVQFLPRGGETASRESTGDSADFDVPPIEGGDDMPW